MNEYASDFRIWLAENTGTLSRLKKKHFQPEYDSELYT